MAFSKINRRAKIKRRIRKRITGTSKVPRLTVFRSNKQIYAQLIDDASGVTLASASSYKNKAVENKNKSEQAAVIGKEVAEKFGIDLNLRPQNLKPETYFKLVKEYEDLRG